MMTTARETAARAESVIEAARREMIAFELKEREFSKKLKRERADELHMPALNNVPKA